MDFNSILWPIQGCWGGKGGKWAGKYNHARNKQTKTGSSSGRVANGTQTTLPTSTGHLSPTSFPQSIL